MDIEKYINNRKILITETEYQKRRKECYDILSEIQKTSLDNTLLEKLIEGYANQYLYWFSFTSSNYMDCIAVENFNAVQSDPYSISLRQIPGLMFLEKVFSRYHTIENIPVNLDQDSLISEVENDLIGSVLWMFSDFSEYNVEFRNNRVLKHKVKIVNVKFEIERYSSTLSLNPENIEFVDIDTGRKISGKFICCYSKFFITEGDLLNYISSVKGRVKERVNNEIASIELQLKSVLEKRRNLYDLQDNLDNTLNNILPK